MPGLLPNPRIIRYQWYLQSNQENAVNKHALQEPFPNSQQSCIFDERNEGNEIRNNGLHLYMALLEPPLNAI